MFCSNCGLELKDDDRFCGRCGTPVKNIRTEPCSKGEVDNQPVAECAERKEFSKESIREDVLRVLSGREKQHETICLFQEGFKKKILGQKLSVDESPIVYFGEKLSGLNVKRVGVAFTTAGIRYNLMKGGVLANMGLSTFIKGSIEYSAIKSIGLVEDSDGEWELFINDKAIGRFITGNEAFGWGKVTDEETRTLLAMLLNERTPHPIGSLQLEDAAQEFGELPGGFVVEDFLNGKPYEKGFVPAVTLSFIGVCAVAFAYQLIKGSFEDDQTLVSVAEQLGAESILGYFICGFLHGGWIHILSNMACLWALGKSVERLFGKVVFLVVYLICIWGGGFVAELLDPGVLAVGASGGIFGLASVLVVYGGFRVVWIRRRSNVSRSINKAVAKWVAENGLFLAQNIFFTIRFAQRFSISIGGHLGGLLVGAVCGLVLIFIRRGKGIE